jgi:hypothetical protein
MDDPASVHPGVTMSAFRFANTRSFPTIVGANTWLPSPASVPTIKIPPLIPIVSAEAGTANPIISPANSAEAQRVAPNERTMFDITVLLFFNLHLL